MIYIAIQNIDFIIQIRYILDYFLLFFDTEYKVVLYKELELLEISNWNLLISYGNNKPEKKCSNKIHIYESYLFKKDYLKPSSLPFTPLEKFNGIPILYEGCKKIADHIRVEFNDDEKLIETDIDIIAGSFFMLTGYEEYLMSERDEFGRFPSRDSMAFKEGFLNKPIVNIYINLLWKWINKLNFKIRKKKIWNGKEFSFCLTHDIDLLKNYSFIPPLKRITHFFLEKDNKRALSIFSEYIRSIVGLDCGRIESLIKLDKRYGLISTFFLKGGGNTEYDDDYYKNNTILKKIISSIKKYGNEIALHGSFNSFENLDIIKSEKKYLEKLSEDEIFGIRQHCLRFSIPKTWDIQEKAGFIYDSSLVFADNVGFKCGVCFPFKPFNLIDNRILNIWEIPLIVMDGSLFDYQCLKPGDGFKIVVSLIKEVRKYNGIFNLLWHNTSMSKSKGLYPGWDTVYISIINYLLKYNIYNNSLVETVRTWKYNFKK